MNILRSAWVILLVFLAETSFSQDSTKMDCSILKNGKFKYVGIDDTTAYVVIKNEDHMEYYDHEKYYIRSKVSWVNDCEYNMTMTKITIPNFPYHPGDVMNVKINRVDGDMIDYTSTVNGVSWKGRFKIIK